MRFIISILAFLISSHCLGGQSTGGGLGSKLISQEELLQILTDLEIEESILELTGAELVQLTGHISDQPIGIEVSKIELDRVRAQLFLSPEAKLRLKSGLNLVVKSSLGEIVSVDEKVIPYLN